MRERFGSWGADLSDADFACALAAAGVLWYRPPQSKDHPQRLGSEILRRTLTAESPTAPWRLVHLPPRFNARFLALAWQSFLEFGGRRLARIEIERVAGLDPRWVHEQLSRPEVGAASVEVRVEGRGTQGRERANPARASYGVGDDERGGASNPGTKGTQSYPVGEDRDTARSVPERRQQAPTRWLQARLRRGAKDVERLRGAGPYLAVIRIGRSDARWVSVERPFPTPEEPSAPEGHWLSVIFWEPRVSPEPQVRPLLLPPKGDTEEISFQFEVPAGLERIAARVTVLHANRVLQTGLLRAMVRGLWAFTLDATPRTRLEGLSARSEFDLALVLNHDADGIPRMTAVSGGEAVVIPVGESAVEALTRALGDQISKIAARPERYETLRSEGSEELLRTLAQHGGQLHRYLSGFEMLGRLEPAQGGGHQPRIHLTAARPDSFFPIELLYRFEVPEDTAKLCGHALSALAQGSCPAECPSEKSDTVCPLGFWGMCRVIERHSHLRVEERPSAGFFDLRPEPTRPRSLLDVSGMALLAASDAASRYEPGAVETLLEKLRRRGPAEQVRSWKDWSARVTADQPRLLVLLPHHERKGGFEVLEIGTADPLKSALVKPRHVSAGSIVLLMGCDTNLAKIAFDSFVIQFILNGAAIVVSTIATILGRHASPATVRLIELLDEEAREEGSTFGEVMLRLRQKLVAEQIPMALGLTAYGDADWILTRQS